MKAVLLSIRPEWCKKIFDGEKTVEVRKTRPKLKTPFKCYIYCTKKYPLIVFASRYDCLRGKLKTCVAPVTGFTRYKAEDLFETCNGRVIGEFICDDIRRIGPEYCVVKEDIESAISGSCLTVPQVKDYAGWKSGMSYADLKDLYGWHISDLKIYDRSRPLRNFTRLRATKFGYEPVDIERPPQSWCYMEDGE